MLSFVVSNCNNKYMKFLVTPLFCSPEKETCCHIKLSTMFWIHSWLSDEEQRFNLCIGNLILLKIHQSSRYSYVKFLQRNCCDFKQRHCLPRFFIASLILENFQSEPRPK